MTTHAADATMATMRTAPDLTVDLRHPPEQRWQLDARQRDQARALLAVYERDLGASPDLIAVFEHTVHELLPPDVQAELQALARQLDVPFRRLLVGTCYYDFVKTVLGCSAFAVASRHGVLHGRNLDWWAADGLLRDATLVTRFLGGSAGEFTTIGWPGFVGALSGVAPGRFAITLNAVLSEEPPRLTTSVAILIRDVLATAATYGDAVQRLANAVIPCDCLLLVSGVQADEMVVIERTPSRHALRHSTDGTLVVTNDYRALAAGGDPSLSLLAATACSRYDALHAELRERAPASLNDCVRPLSLANVRMTITVQQMAFCASTGQYALHVPKTP